MAGVVWVGRAVLCEHLAYFAIDVARDDAGSTEGNAVVEGATNGVEALPRCAIRRSDEDGVRGIRPTTVDPGRGVGEHEVFRTHYPAARHAAARRRPVRASRHGEDARHALPRLPEHPRCRETCQLRFG